MSLKLYSALGSPAVRSTLLTIRALGIKDKVKIVEVNIRNQEQLKPEFIKLNPVHTVPVLEDGNFVLWDSHAINAYLVNVYGENDALYPKDPQKRAIVDSINHFDTGYIFSRAKRIQRAVFSGDKSVKLEKIYEEVLDDYDILELILEKRCFAAGDQMTIADFNLVTTVSSMEAYVPLKNDRHPNIIRWFQKMKQLPYYGINQKGIDMFNEFFIAMLAKR